MTKFSCVVMGNESLLIQCSEKLLAAGRLLRAVITRSGVIADWAAARGLPVVAPGRELAARLGTALDGQPVDWLLSIANLDMVPRDVLALPVRGAVNFHDGPLPRHAGLNAPVWALIEGEARHGITWHMIEGGVDEGDILVQRLFDVSDTDTALTLNTKCFAAAIDSFDDLIVALASGAPKRSAQDLSHRSYHARADRPALNGGLDFGGPAAQAERLVRALDHGGYWNPLCTAKVVARGAVLHIGKAVNVAAAGAPGAVLSADDDQMTVAFDIGALSLSGLRDGTGATIRPKDVVAVGEVLTMPELEADLAASDAFWRGELAKFSATEIPSIGVGQGAIKSLPLDGAGAGHLLALAAQLGEGTVGVAYAHRDLQKLAEGGNVCPWVPFVAETDKSLGALVDSAAATQERLRSHTGFAADLLLRDPALRAIGTPQIGLSDGVGMISGTALTMDVAARELHYDSVRLPEVLAQVIAARLLHIATQPAGTPLADLLLMPPDERSLMLDHWNATATDHDRNQTMHRAFEAQVARTPDAPALVFEATTLSYAALNARANRAAHVLRDMGVGPGKVVGLCTRRSVDLMVGALAILKAGGAYLPLDPAYPASRLAHFISDSAAPVIVTQAGLVADLPPHAAELLVLDSDPRLVSAADTNLPDTSGPQDLAYLIYTSGSTGTPKGVMVEHRNVANFYVGMDQRLNHDPAGTWLAVTSLSFDISVLELFYATARGFKVVLTSDEDRGLISNGPMATSGGMEFSVYYWGNDDGAGRDKYRLLLEGAKFADQHGFCAVWTPERHFHAFGGPYPNPSVTGAAVAAVTQNIGVRGGSCVAPLHHPARIAEEWAVIDNLTGGRAGMAIASGWQPDDFVLRPENTPPNNKAAMIDSIETVRKLWRGEAVAFPKQDGTLHEVITQPRPVSKELPVWVTTAGNPETWKEAGRLGCNVLTHLLGQTVDEVAGKITLYHAALREAGHDPAQFKVTLMLHSYIAGTLDEARETAREPMKDYLRSAAGLIKQYAWAFPAFKKPEGVKNPFELDLGSLSDEEMDGILEFAFERYFNDSGLFGTIDDAVARTEELKKIGVTEIACLIDYGIDTDTVLEGLKPLAEVLRRTNLSTELAADDFSIAAQIVRHDVTHLQCTPSMARMIAMNDEARFALSRVQHIMLGGEPLPGALVAEFAQMTNASLTNMYGPTETTIWSATEVAHATDGVVNIGLPIANTQLYVLDDAQQPVPLGVPGELWIGGEGVTRGYWNRADLTAERFVANPFHPGRMYRTGDLVRRRADGKIDFVGRVDHQVKLRGFRIELGEIEAVIEAQPGIRQAVVAAREDQPGDVRLVAYVTSDATVDETALKAAMGGSLPDYMLPSRILRLDAFPLTPNKKVDRGALPAPTAIVVPKRVPRLSAPIANGAAHSDAAIEVQIAEIWSRVLGTSAITGRDNFFDLGGHSLLAVQTHRLIRDEIGARKLSITDIFRFPTLSGLAGRVAALIQPTQAADKGTALTAAPEVPAAAIGARVVGASPTPVNDRASARNDAMARRRAMRARRSA
ncbi:MupA/Atu3671 family FMN-dependent luciferase-like monooxygenase [Puniceibacterium sp. IMCC21224]|uniref:MupA/Atu3671 family FMN-dependent luciferase-like monooxygenase n=1 Tax=Puniceibacterium sp. IMCC21224 TaxID=1618204 RepID=UPI00064D8049|nr:MupA/Atu3671 family FMN-dependent luciferase-like monooxygenase [Puniceibacterium sp. IMCC21224]KMK65643.1 natural product biosynthesis luciferase-like monooxygenase domain [Puniceibacterium sp. IMCC21224]